MPCLSGVSALAVSHQCNALVHSGMEPGRHTFCFHVMMHDINDIPALKNHAHEQTTKLVSRDKLPLIVFACIVDRVPTIATPL